MIEILLACYNGEKYIYEQINSILAQSFQDFKILIRDDSSTDDTFKIICDFENKYPDKIKIIRDNVTCKSPGSNFFELLKHAQADYIMFCDRDDFWLPDKIKITFDEMQKLENLHGKNTPILVYGDAELVDQNLKNPMGIFCGKHYTNFNKLLMRYCITGCLMMINKILYENLGDYKSEMGLHDRWIGLYASAFGIIKHVPVKLMLYRQHAHNVTSGLNNDVSSQRRLKNFIGSPLKKIKDYKNYSLNGLKAAELFKSMYAEKLKNYPEIEKYLNNFIWLYSKKCKFKLVRIFMLIKYGYIYRDFITAVKQIICI